MGCDQHPIPSLKPHLNTVLTRQSGKSNVPGILDWFVAAREWKRKPVSVIICKVEFRTNAWSCGGIDEDTLPWLLTRKAF